MLSAKLAEAEAKIENYDALKNELEEAQRKITELNHEMAENQRAAEYEKASLQAEMERKLSEKVKDAELILERTMQPRRKRKRMLSWNYKSRMRFCRLKSKCFRTKENNPVWKSAP